MVNVSMPTKKARKRSPKIPPWLKAALKTASRKPNDELTMRDIDAVIAEVRAGRSPDNYKPIKLSITLRAVDAAWLKKLAAEQHCSIEEILMKAVWVYRYGQHDHLQADREYFTKAIAESTDQFKTGRYEK